MEVKTVYIVKDRESRYYSLYLTITGIYFIVEYDTADVKEISQQEAMELIEPKK